MEQGAAGLNRPTSDSTTECIEKVEAMISTAILHQEDVWNMLLSLFPEKSPAEVEPGHGGAGQSHLPDAVKETLEKAMDWCRLAQFRLKGLITDSQPSPRRGVISL